MYYRNCVNISADTHKSFVHRNNHSCICDSCKSLLVFRNGQVGLLVMLILLVVLLKKMFKIVKPRTIALVVVCICLADLLACSSEYFYLAICVYLSI